MSKFKKTLFVLVVLLTGSCIDIQEHLPGGLDYQENNQFIAFHPQEPPVTGFIYYPGALVPTESYNDWMEALAREGYLTVVARMPFNLAVLDVTAAARIRAKFPDIQHWIIGGHSLGGAMAVQFINDNQGSDLFQALVLTGSYPSSDISDWGGKVLSLYGTNDLISTPEEIQEGLPLLPPSVVVEDVAGLGSENATYLHAIEGGNHAQFGNYGVQAGDGVAAISREEQHAEMVTYIQAFFAANGW